MSNHFNRMVLCCLLCSIGIHTSSAFALCVPGSQDENEQKKREAAEVIFAGKLNSVVAGPVGLSSPPVRTHSLTFTVTDVFRGKVETRQEISCTSVLRQEAEPVFPVDKACIVYATQHDGRFNIIEIEAANGERLLEAGTIARYPIGWTKLDGNWYSPWEALEGDGWNAEGEAKFRCHATGRPALLVGEKARFEVSVVPPEKSIKWTNPDGDGLYKITVSNPTGEAIEVPALLVHNDKVLWRESLVIVCQNKTYTLPAAQGVPAGAHSLTLQPGESVSTDFHIFEITGPQWPQGGYRIEFQFCLGELSRLQSFYYMSSHHDSIREDIQKGLSEKMSGNKDENKAEENVKQEDTAISGSLTINSDEESFANATAWVRVWEYDPLLADAAAKQFAESRIDDIVHETGKATEIPFSIGGEDQLNAAKKYYLTVFVYRDGKVGQVENEIFFLDGFNKVELPATGFSGELKKLDR